MNDSNLYLQCIEDYLVYEGDCVEGLRTLDEGSVRTCVTSPPYFGLRDYGHEDQIGLESTPNEFVAALVRVFREVRRVLADDGTAWLNLGDSYATQGGSHAGRKDQRGVGAARVLDANAGDKGNRTAPEGLKPKDLIGIPWRVAFALQSDGWYLRQDIIWHKPNPMPESVRDRCTKSHEYLFLLSKSPRYYFDAEAIAEPLAKSSVARLSQKGLADQKGSSRVPGKTNGNMKAVGPRFGGNKYGDDGTEQSRTKSGARWTPKPKRNRRSVWTVTTKPFKGAHFAVFPPDLIEPCILAGSEPGDLVLDPFAGSGTTGMVAGQHGRQFFGCELNPEYAQMARERIAPCYEEKRNPA